MESNSKKLNIKYFTYILYSKEKDRYYVGQTSNLDDRINRHRNSGSKSTKFTNDWELVYCELFESRSEAVQREQFIKEQKSRRFIQSLLNL